jgi:hypothetical protein
MPDVFCGACGAGFHKLELRDALYGRRSCTVESLSGA